MDPKKYVTNPAHLLRVVDGNGLLCTTVSFRVPPPSLIVLVSRESKGRICRPLSQAESLSKNAPAKVAMRPTAVLQTRASATAASKLERPFEQPFGRRVLGHCCRWFTDMTAAGEDPIAVIQWRVQFVDREWPLSGKSNAR